MVCIILNLEELLTRRVQLQGVHRTTATGSGQRCSAVLGTRQALSY